MMHKWERFLRDKGCIGENNEIIGFLETDCDIMVNGATLIIRRAGKQINKAFIEGDFIKVGRTYYLLDNVNGIG